MQFKTYFGPSVFGSPYIGDTRFSEDTSEDTGGRVATTWELPLLLGAKPDED